MRAKRQWAILLVLVLSALVAGCSRTQSERGVAPVWRSLPVDALESGATTKSQLMDALGPPSQVITHSEGEIFYYLHEETSTRGLVLIFYNTSQTSTYYDRAIFFFDRDGILQEYSVSAEESG